jgi:NTE family protein
VPAKLRDHAQTVENPYDRLVLASGSMPRPLDVPGEDLRSVHTFRTLDDAESVRHAAESADRALVVGAGFIGMETSASLRRRGLEVTLIEPGDFLFAALRNPAVSAELVRLYRDRGITVLLGDSVVEFHGSGGRLTSASTRGGQTIGADLAIIGIGVEPSTGYLDGTDIARDRGSVVVDEHFRTSDPSVFAIGDLARFYDPLAGHRRQIQHWTNASHQGERLGRTLAGEDAPYDQVAYFFTEVLGIKLGLLGDLDGGYDRTVTHGSLEDGLVSYYLKDDYLVAALISGQTSETQQELTTLLRNHAHRSDLRQPDEARASR